MLADDDDTLMTITAQKQTSQQPAWMRTLFERCREWLGVLPTVSFLSRFHVLKSAERLFLDIRYSC